MLNVLSFTDDGSRMNADICRALTEAGEGCGGYAVGRFASRYGLRALPGDVKGWIGEQWGRSAFLFVGAAGIAIRYIAPWVKDKFSDSPVLVMDEAGRYVIPLLSGHVGGAVDLSRQIAEVTGAVPVITTATDVREQFAVDVFAKRNGLIIGSRRLAKEISAAVLEHKEIGFFSELPLSSGLPGTLMWCDAPDELLGYPLGIEVSRTRHIRSDKVLWLEAKAGIIVGIGCRRDTGKEKLWSGLMQVLGENGLVPEQIAALVSIELKKDEAGLLELAEELQVPFMTYSAEELGQVKAVSAGSAFVARTTGVDNVCERAAKYHCGDGELLQPKVCREGCTYAIVKEHKTLTV